MENFPRALSTTLVAQLLSYADCTCCLHLNTCSFAFPLLASSVLVLETFTLAAALQLLSRATTGA